MSAAVENEAQSAQIEAQVMDLRNVLHPSTVDITTEVTYLLRNLNDLRQREPRVCFHLLMDQDFNPGNAKPHGSQLRIVYSPILCMSDTRQCQLIQTIAGLMGLLNGLSNGNAYLQNVPQHDPGAQQTEVTAAESLPSSLALISTLPRNERDDLRLF